MHKKNHIEKSFKIAEAYLEKRATTECFELCHELEQTIEGLHCISKKKEKGYLLKLKKMKLRLNAIIVEKIKNDIKQ